MSVTVQWLLMKTMKGCPYLIQEAIRRICKVRGMRIGDEEEKELSKEKRGKGARRAGIMANG